MQWAVFSSKASHWNTASFKGLHKQTFSFLVAKPALPRLSFCVKSPSFAFSTKKQKERHELCASRKLILTPAVLKESLLFPLTFIFLFIIISILFYYHRWGNGCFSVAFCWGDFHPLIILLLLFSSLLVSEWRTNKQIKSKFPFRALKLSTSDG